MGDDRQHQSDTGSDGADGADRTQRIPPGGGAGADRTQRIPPSGGGGAEPTQRIPPGGGETRRYPADQGASSPADHPGSAPWSGRAGVPPPRPAGYRTDPGEWYGEEQPNRRWWLPILLGIVALVLFGVLGLGLWLIVDANQGDDPDESPPAPATSAPARTPAPTSAPATTSAPTTAPATTAPATTPPGTTAPATTATAIEIPMPPVVGLPQAAAEAVLERLGLAYRVEPRESALPAGTVVATDPRPGRPVRSDQQVTLVVAVDRDRSVPTTGPGRNAAGRLPVT